VREVRLGEGPLEAVLLPEVGARLHRLRAFGQDLLRTPADPEGHRRDPFFWGAYVMAPWSNRIATAPTAVGGRTVRVTPNFPDGSAIHGQVSALPWTEIAPGTFGARGGDDGWPWPYEVTLSAQVAERVLTLRWRLTNLADEPMPAGLGFHPWWRRPVWLRVTAGLAYASNVAPDEEPAPVADPLDLRSLAAPADGLDGTWTDPSLGRVELSWPGLGLRATMRSTQARFVAVATPPGLDAIAVEPQTHAPDGLRRLLGGRSDGLAWLAGGGSLPLDLEIEVSRR
jgi:aldose 1-epimerase